MNVIDDLSTLTTINKQVLLKLETKLEWCICNAIDEAIKEGKQQVEIDLELGMLYIDWTNSEIRYKFKPNQKLEKQIVNVIVNERNDLVLNIENSLVSKLTNVYKSFF